jgi:hypothetical protein
MLACFTKLTAEEALRLDIAENDELIDAEDIEWDTLNNVYQIGHFDYVQAISRPRIESHEEFLARLKRLLKSGFSRPTFV